MNVNPRSAFNSDVPGVFTADPRLVPNARKLPTVSYEEMLEMSASGAKVLMLRAVELARKFNGEIISADSRQVYKGLNIGTGKITKKEMRGIPHHMLDIANPKKVYTVSDYQKLANKKIN